MINFANKTVLKDFVQDNIVDYNSKCLCQPKIQPKGIRKLGHFTFNISPYYYAGSKGHFTNRYNPYSS